jgi:uncharacterized protein
MDSVRVIDSLEFARTGAELQGRVAIAQLERLTDSLYDRAGSLEFRIRGSSDAGQRPRLEVSVTGEINLKCQRCMGSLPFPVAVKSSLLVLAGSAAVETAELDELDGIPADAHADVWALVEDEVLLAIPYAARHPEGQCAAAVDLSVDRAASPFAVLAKLRQDHD